jgi:hypothetical protein
MSAPTVPSVPADQVKEGYYWSSLFLEIVSVSKNCNGRWVIWRTGDERTWPVEGEFVGPLLSPYKRKKK